MRYWRVSVVVVSLAMVLVLGRGISGSVPSKSSEPLMDSGTESVALLEKGNKVIMSVGVVPKSGGAVLKALFPPGGAVNPRVPLEPAYDAVALDLELQTADDGTKVLLAHKLMQVVSGKGDTGVRIIKTVLDHGELVVVFSLKAAGMSEELGVWHVLVGSDKGAKVQPFMRLMSDELSFLGVWSLDQQPLPELSKKTVGVGLKRGEGGRWVIELSSILWHPDLRPAVFEQKEGHWEFTRTHMLGDD